MSSGIATREPAAAGSKLKALARAVLNRLVNRRRFNDSWLYRAYTGLANPRYARDLRTEETFYRDVLAPLRPRLVFDLGANHGHKTRIFAGLAERVIAIEANPATAEALRERFLRNAKVTVVAKGAAAAEGTARLRLFAGSDTISTFSDKWGDARDHAASHEFVDVPLTTVDRLVQEFGRPDYLKIDVEGYELEVLRGLSTAVPLVSFECNLPEFAAETLDCLERLQALSPAAAFNYCVKEPPGRLESEQWLSSAEMAAVVRSGGYSYMEIYARTAVSISTNSRCVPPASSGS
jgi:FkbM family methyltransferase